MSKVKDKSRLDCEKNVALEDMEERYERGQAMMQGMFTKAVAFNTTVIPHWIGDTHLFWYERELKSGKQFRIVNAKEKSNSVAFDHESLGAALARASEKYVDACDLPISKIEISLSPFEIIFDAFGTRWKFSADNRSCSAISSFCSGWLISPNGEKAVFVRDYNIWMRDLGSGKEVALTQDGEPFYSYASTPSAWGANLVMPGLEALWSPDSKRLFTLQLDTRGLNTLPMIDHVPHDGSIRPSVIHEDRRMAFPGDSHIDEYRFLSIEVETGKQQEAHFRRCPVFRNAMGFFTQHNGWWGDNCRHTYFIDLERGGDHIARLLEFDTYTGDVRVVIQEQSLDACFKLHLDSYWPTIPRPLAGSDDIVWYSERTGWAHLYLYDRKTGLLKHPITQGEWIVRDIHHYDPTRRELVIQTAGRVKGRHAYYRDICRVNVDTGLLTPIISTDDEYTVFDEEDVPSYNLSNVRDTSGGAGVSPDGRYVVTTCSRADTVPISLLLDRDGNELLCIETADVSGLPKGWQWPEPVKLTAADGETDIYGLVYRPSCFSTNQSYPIIDFSWTHQESCPIDAGSFTNNCLGGMFYFRAAALAQLGFIVVDIYARGTSCRHRAFSADPDPHLPGSNNQADRVSGIRQLAERYPYMDINRVGAGGNVSTNVAVSGLLGNPEFYKVGVTNGSVTDHRLKSAFYAEAYGDLPATEKDKKLTHTYAGNLKGKLLIMHGMLHPTIPVADPFRLIDEFQRANKDFDMLLLPKDGYGMSSYALRRCWDYFVKHLLGVEPPPQFDLTTSYDLVINKTAKQAFAVARK